VNQTEPINISTGARNPLASGQIGVRYIGPAVGCLLALTAGWFITSDLNPFATTLILAALITFVVAACNPTTGVYLLILVSGYLDLIKRLGILTEALSGLDVVVTLAVAPLLLVSICAGVLYRNIISRTWLKRWQIVLAMVIIIAMIAVFFQAFFRGGGPLFALKDFANNGA
jgi:hypothetical protein